MAPVFIGTAWLASRNWRKNLGGAVIAFVVFGIVSGPFVYALSKQKHRLTFGDTGRIAYSYFMDQIQEPVFWEGGNGTGTAKHAPRVVLASPRVYEFATPIPGSYPLWYDPSYWHDGIEPHFRFINEIKILRESAGTFFLIWLAQTEYAVGLLALFLCLSTRQAWLSAIGRMWPIWLPPAAACLAYSSVLVEGRYVAPFLAVLWIVAFAACMVRQSAANRRVTIAIILAVVLATGVKTLKLAATDALTGAHQKDPEWEAAQALKDLGLEPGDHVALIGVIGEQHLLRLARVKAVSELIYGHENEFWAGTDTVQQSVFTAFTHSGAKLVIANRAPLTAGKEGWVRLGDTDFYAHPLPSGP